MTMGKEVQNIIALLHQWQKFSSEKGGDFHAFGKWLTEQTSTENTEAGEKETAAEFKNRYLHDKIPLEDQVVLYWGRLQRYTHLWSKKALKDLPINSMEEFGLLKSVQLLGKARKSDLVRFTLTEATTCFEMIKRLVKAGYLHEEIDPEDRRSRLVRLTAKGEALSKESEKQVRLLSRLLIGDLSTQQKLELLGVLKDLDSFHGKLYERDAHESLENMLPNT